MSGPEARRTADRRLFARYRRTGDPAAREELVRRFLPLAHRLARRHASGGGALDDLRQVASLALVKAIDGFDPARGTTFASYAVPTIAGELKRYFRDTGWTVHVPRHTQEMVLRTARAGEALTRELGRAPTSAEIARRCDTTVEEVLEAQHAAVAHHGLPLDGADDETDGCAARLGVDEPGFARTDAALTLEPLLRRLGALEREVLRLRFQDDLTQAEIGARIGCSQMRVSVLIRRAIERMREAGAQAEAVATGPARPPAAVRLWSAPPATRRRAQRA